jgi:tetratricopeptide (TPR) repeat protein
MDWFPARKNGTAGAERGKRLTARSLLIASSAAALILAGCTDTRTEHISKSNSDVYPAPGADADLGTAPAAGPSAAIVRTADQARASGDLAGAIQMYRRAIIFEPTSTLPLIRLGDALAESGQLRDAMEAYDEVLDREPDNQAALRGTGNVLIRLDQPILALEKLDRVIAANPNDVRALNSAGVALDKLGKYSAAQDSYRKALVIDRDNDIVRGNLGLSLAFSGDYDTALETLGALAKAPQSTARARQNYALVLGLAGRMDEAAAVARQDLDEDSVQQNLGYYEILRGTDDLDRRVDAIAVNAGQFEVPSQY